MTEKNSVANRHSYSNHRFNDTRTHSIPGLNETDSEWNGNSAANSKMPLSAIRKNTQDQFNGHGNSISCDNIFERPMLQVSIPDESTPKHTPERSISVEYDPAAKHGNSLPKPITRSSSKEMLLMNETPNHAPLEPKKTKPKKPNRESLRRSRPDIRASHPNLPSHRSSAIPNTFPEHNLTVPGPATLPGHDYEELSTDIKILQQRHRVSQQQLDATPILKIVPSDIGLSPSASQSQPSPALPERTRNPRQRMNPLYAGMHSNPYERESSGAELKVQRPPIWCLRCLVVGVVFAIVLSVLSAAAASLLFIGYHEPLKVFANDEPSKESILIENLQREISMLKNNSNITEAHINYRLSETKNDLLNAVKSLNFSALKGPDTADVANCFYNKIEIGNSWSRDEIKSGQYFPEKGFVTTLSLIHI